MSGLKVLGDPDPRSSGGLRVLGDAAAPDEKIYINDAGQPFTASGAPVPQPEPDQSYTGGILPFARDKAGHLSFALPTAITAPILGAEEGGKRALGVGEQGRDPLRPLSPNTMSTLGALAGTRAIGMGDRAAADVVTAATPEAAAARQQVLTENRARGAVSTAFGAGVKGGAPTAAETMAELARGKAQGQPMALIDAANPEVQSLAGTTYRQGGAARSAIKKFFTGRDEGATDRVEGLINTHLTDDSYKQTFDALKTARSAHAKPLWDEARKGGSIAPLESQFQQFYVEAGAAERAAAQKVVQANQALTAASAKQSIAGNVYATSAANTVRRAADAQLKQALSELSQAQKTKSDLLERLQQAQADRSANAPGAIWSPRLQQFLDHPDVQKGIRIGYANERRTALGKGEPFNPSEYAVTGVDKEGNPVVGKVPNMALLMTAKEGLDAVIEKEIVPETGLPTKRGLSFIELRNGLVNELDRLNPAYKPAREQWSGDTASIMAARAGRHLFDERWFPSQEDLVEKFGKMSDSDKQFFIIGVADKLKSLLYRTVDASDKGRIINNENVRRMIRPLFKSAEDAETFLDAMERERTMKASGNTIMRGSQTAERGADDRNAEIAMRTAQGIGQLLSHGYLGAAMSAWKLRQFLGKKPDPELNMAIQKLLTSPDVPLQGTGPVLPPRPVPPKPGVSSLMPAPTRLDLLRAAPGALSYGYGGSLDDAAAGSRR